jgi:hypothetical protein
MLDLAKVLLCGWAVWLLCSVACDIARIWSRQAPESIVVGSILGVETSHRKSLRLLLEWLTPEQEAELAKTGSFHVVGEATGVRYRISGREPNHNVHALGDGTELCRLCFEPKGNLPVGDRLLAQKLALETDERSALAVANPGDPWGMKQLLSKLPEGYWQAPSMGAPVTSAFETPF